MFYKEDMLEQVSVDTANLSYRIVPESDPARGERYIFPPIQQAIFWLTHGRDPNQTDGLQVRMPFIAQLSGTEQQEFTTALQGSLRLYRDEIQEVSRDEGQDGSRILLGSYIHKKRGSPALIIKQSNEGLTLGHTWIESSREKRFR